MRRWRHDGQRERIRRTPELQRLARRRLPRSGQGRPDSSAGRQRRFARATKRRHRPENAGCAAVPDGAGLHPAFTSLCTHRTRIGARRASTKTRGGTGSDRPNAPSNAEQEVGRAHAIRRHAAHRDTMRSAPVRPATPQRHECPKRRDPTQRPPPHKPRPNVGRDPNPKTQTQRPNVEFPRFR